MGGKYKNSFTLCPENNNLFSKNSKNINQCYVKKNIDQVLKIN